MGPQREPGDVDAPWLERFLRECAGFPEARVGSATFERIGEGFGLDCVVLRVRVTDGDGAPERLVLKWSGRGRGAREALVLRDLGPRHGWHTPRFLGALEDEDAWILALEDLWDGRQADVLAGISEQDAARILTAEAAYHGAYWGRPDHPDLALLPRWGDSLEGESARTDAAVAGFLEVGAELLPPGAEEAARRAAGWIPAARAFLAEAPQTLIHADLHADNVLFRADGRPVLLDWPEACRGPAARDVAHLLIEGVRPELRAASGDRLVAGYLDALAAAGTTYDADRFREEVRQATRVLFANAIRWLSSPPASTMAHPRARRLGPSFALCTTLAVLDDGI